MDYPLATTDDLREKVSYTLRQTRVSKGLSLNGLAEKSGIGKATLSGIERGEGNPTIETLWNLAKALDVPFGELLGKDSESTVTSLQKGVKVELVDKQAGKQRIETYLMDITNHQRRLADPHMEGVSENILVLKGQLLTGPVDAPALVNTGQHYTFKSDTPHIYQGVSDQCRALVSVVYPSHDKQSPHVSEEYYSPWPHTDDDWDGLIRRIERISLEITHGITTACVHFADCELEPELALKALEDRLQKNRAPTDYLPLRLVFDKYPMVIFLRHEGYHEPLQQFTQDAFIDGNIRLANRGLETYRPLTPSESEKLHQSAGSAIVSEATLAAEVLTRHNQPTVPKQAAPSFVKSNVNAQHSDEHMFEDRISVDDYAAYELVHPAYAKQAVAVATELQTHLETPAASIIDVGTGPGLPLKMILEMLPSLQVTAVDPSRVAFAHLQVLFKDYANVTPLCESITAMKPTRKFQGATSIGASHHLNTLDFLASTRDQLETGAHFFISDEMIKPFKSIKQRTLNLICHHLRYIADIMIDVSLEGLTAAEATLVTLIQQQVPLALHEAHSGNQVAAERRVRELYQSIKALDLPNPVSHPSISFYRLHVLELEALVAGMDYEVEQKTYPQRFHELARRAGFEMIKHQRLYATHGDDHWDAGTHLFVLKTL